MEIVSLHNNFITLIFCDQSRKRKRKTNAKKPLRYYPMQQVNKKYTII